MKFKILDCTLRDGGYYTNWNFSSEIVNKYLETISKLPVDIIEIGYISSKKDSNGPFYHLPLNFLKILRSKISKKQKICVMINAKEIKSINDLSKLIKKYFKFIDIVRFAIDPKKINSFLKILTPVKTKYKKITFNVNLMYLSKWYTKTEFTKKIVNRLVGKCDTVAFVDSYGALKPLEVLNFFKSIPVTKKLKIGCHFHNNCGLALANTLSALKGGCELADTTIKGMGRGAGNAETELLMAIYKSKKINISNYEFDSLLEEFKKIKEKLNWGSSFSYAYAANMGFSQSKMMDLLQKKRLDTGVALQAISSKLDNKSDIKFNNIKRLAVLKKTIPVLIGGAPSFVKYGGFLLRNIQQNVPIILSGSNAFFNYMKLKIKIKNPIILVLSGSELKKIKLSKKNMLKQINLHTLIIEKDFILKNLNIKKSKIVISESCAVNPLLLTGLLLIKIKCKKLYVSNFDGDYETEKGRSVMKETNESVKYLKSKKLTIEALNNTYLNVKKINIWSNDKFFYSNQKK